MRTDDDYTLSFPFSHFPALLPRRQRRSVRAPALAALKADAAKSAQLAAQRTAANARRLEGAPRLLSRFRFPAPPLPSPVSEASSAIIEL